MSRLCQIGNLSVFSDCAQLLHAAIANIYPFMRLLETESDSTKLVQEPMKKLLLFSSHSGLIVSSLKSFGFKPSI